MPQTSYLREHASSYLGTWASVSPDNKAITGHNKNGSEIAFGRAVTVYTSSAIDANDYSPAKLFDATGAKFLGVAVHSMNFEAAYFGGTTKNGPADGELFDIATRGAVNVWVEEAVGPESPVYVRHTANGTGKEIGQFRKSADAISSVDSAVLVTKAAFRGRTTGAGIVALEINLP